MIERLDFTKTEYNALEAAIHLARYSLAKNICQDKIVLDISCGQGYGSYFLSEWGARYVTGVDIDKHSIQIANELFRKENTNFVCQNGEDLSLFENGAFDLIVANETVEHVENPVKFLTELKRVCRSDGVIIVTCPNDYFYYPTKDKFNPFHFRKYTIDEFKYLVEPVLGSVTQMLLGAPITGYINISEDSHESTTRTQMRMLECLDAQAIICPGNKVQASLSRYFAAIWAPKPLPAVLFPAVLFPDYEATSYSEVVYKEMQEDILKLQNDIKQKTNEYGTLEWEHNGLIKSYKKLNIQVDEYILYLDSLQANYDKLWGNFEQASSRNVELQSFLDGLQVNYDKLWQNYEQVKKQNGDLRSGYEEALLKIRKVQRLKIYKIYKKCCYVFDFFTKRSKS